LNLNGAEESRFESLANTVSPHRNVRFTPGSGQMFGMSPKG
jgi:hypothetical protein